MVHPISHTFRMALMASSYPLELLNPIPTSTTELARVSM